MIRKAEQKDIETLAALAGLLWGGHTPEELAGEIKALLARGDACFFLKEADGAAVGFAQCQLRHDYVEGTGTSPVGYLEGIFVKEGHRHRGYARELLAACEDWARDKGCVEFASDCELDNAASLRFHLALNFTEANRIICFRKSL